MIEIYDAEMKYLGRTWNYADMEITHDLNTGTRQMAFRALYRDDQPDVYLMMINWSGTWGSISDDPEGGIQKFDFYDPETGETETIDLGEPLALPTGNYAIRPEYHIRTENDIWTVKKVSGSKIDGLTVSCVLDTEELESTLYKSLTAEEQGTMALDERTETMRSAAGNNAYQFDKYWDWWRCGGPSVDPPWATFNALAAYGDDHVDWRILPSGITRRRAMWLQNFTQLGYLQAIAVAYMCEIKIDSLRMEVSFCDRVGADKGIYLTRGFNVDKIDRESDSYDYKTVIYPIGKNGLTIETATGTEYSGCDHEAGSAVLTNFAYSNKPIIYRWEDSTYEDAEALAEDAGRLLAELAHPIEAYSVAPRYVQASTDLQHDTSQWEVGDTVTLADSATDSLATQRIVRKKEYPLAPWKNSFEIANCVLTWSQIQAKIKAMEQISMGTKSSGRITVQEILHG